jgi:GNAT superfamily N-acetyltransferase
MARKAQDDRSRESLETSIGTCTVELATTRDLANEQWTPGELPVSYFERLVAEGAVWLLQHDGRIVGTVGVSWSEPTIWRERDTDEAGYIRGLVIDRNFAGKGLGRDLLHWAEAHIRFSACQLARLDCVRTNGELRNYYEQEGYRHVGYKDFPRCRRGTGGGSVREAGGLSGELPSQLPEYVRSLRRRAPNGTSPRSQIQPTEIDECAN